MSKEIEIKLIVDEVVFNRYLEELKDVKQVRQVDTYFDTASHDLEKNNESLRIRDSINEGKSMLTYKYGRERNTKMLVREEIEVNLPPEAGDEKELKEIFEKLGIYVNANSMDRNKAFETLQKFFNIIGIIEKDGFRVKRDGVKISSDRVAFNINGLLKGKAFIIEFEGDAVQVESDYYKLVEKFGSSGSIKISEKSNFQMLLDYANS